MENSEEGRFSVSPVKLHWGGWALQFLQSDSACGFYLLMKEALIRSLRVLTRPEEKQR